MVAQGSIHLHRSNRTELLAATLAEILRSDPLSPMEEEWIVVQGPGMQRWLSIELATSLGVWANARFPFPRHLVETAMRGVLDLEDEEPSVLQPGPLLWAVARELQECKGHKDFAEIRQYLDLGVEQGLPDSQLRRRSERKLFQLAERVAGLLERYTIYRPELLADWESGRGDGWQPALWRSLTKRHDNRHPGAMLTRFLEEVGKGSSPITGIPRRVCLFGISSLPPIYMRVLSALAQRVELHLFVLSPSREYWADLRRRGRTAEPQEEEGNALLASLGRLSGDFQQVLEDNAQYQETDQDLYRAPAMEEGMLATLQADILDLRSRGQGQVSEHSPPCLSIAPEDCSIAIHSCHSPMREVEVMHDQIVSLLEADPTLQARDIVVMTPDIESYAPLIDAVFASDAKDRPRIPYRIADRSDRSTFPVLQAFAKVLATLGGRMSASEVLELLSFEVIASRFEIEDEDLEQIKSWIVGAGIRWGVDAEHRDSVGQPALAENTWQFGLDRLLLGYAMEGGDKDLYGDVLPFDDVEGNHTKVLGHLLEFSNSLFRFRQAIAKPTSLSQWSSMLSALLATMVQLTESNVGEHRLIRDCVDELVTGASVAGFTDELSFDTVKSALEQGWNSGGSARGFLSGGVTFCQLMPMRSIPFRIVCVLGMSDGSFPRSVHPLAFDQMAAAPKTGDRTPRDDDRYLFLEAILSARQALLISYVGRSIRSNAILPPSVLVGELLELMSDSFTAREGTVEERIVVQHPLQPFSPLYFGHSDDTRLFSYSKAYGRGALSLGDEVGASEPFLAGPLSLEEGIAREVSIDELVRFFANPTKNLLQNRLGLFLEEEDSVTGDREPMSLAGLERYQVGDELLRRSLHDDDSLAVYSSVRAGGKLPLGAVGRVHYEALNASAMSLRACALQYTEESPLESLNVDRMIGDTRLTGTLSDLWPSGRVQVAYTRLGKSSELGHWIRHLCLCLVAPSSQSRRTILIGRAPKSDGLLEVIFSEAEDPEEQLAHMIQLYWAGQVAPIPFFPGTARAFAATLSGAKPSALEAETYQKARKAALSAFEGSGQFPGESEDPYVSQVFHDSSCLDADFLPFDDLPPNYASFEEIASRLFAPLLAAREHSSL